MTVLRITVCFMSAPVVVRTFEPYPRRPQKRRQEMSIFAANKTTSTILGAEHRTERRKKVKADPRNTHRIGHFFPRCPQSGTCISCDETAPVHQLPCNNILPLSIVHCLQLCHTTHAVRQRNLLTVVRQSSDNPDDLPASPAEKVLRTRVVDTLFRSCSRRRHEEAHAGFPTR